MRGEHYHYYQIWLEIAKQHGYFTVDEAIIALSSKRSSRYIASLFGVSLRTICRHRKRLNCSAPRGGKNNSGSNKKCKYNYKNIPLKQYCEEHQLNYKLILQRIRRYGWSLQHSISTPSRRKSQ